MSTKIIKKYLKFKPPLQKFLIGTKFHLITGSNSIRIWQKKHNNRFLTK